MGRQIFATSPRAPGFPPCQFLCLATGAKFATREICEDVLPVALAGGFATAPAVEVRLN
jgi:hypothetical protein